MRQNRDAQIEQFAREVKTTCRTAVQWYLKGIELYRGMREPQIMGHKKIRQDRKPLSSNPLENAVFESIIRVKRLPPRSKSMFVTRSRIRSSEYGNTYIVFPMDGSTYYFFPDIQDMTLNYPDVMGLYHPNERKKLISEIEKAKSVEEIGKIMKEFARNDENYQKSIKGSLSKATEDHLWGMFDGKVDQFLKTYNRVFHNKGIDRNKDQEIMFQSNKGYYWILDGAVRENKLKELLYK